MLIVWMLSWGVAVLVSVRQLPRAEKSGAVFSLLAKPLSRGEFMTGKWLGAWIVSSIAALVFTLVVILVTALHGGTYDAITLLQAVLLHCGALAVICAAGIAFSTAMGEDAAMATTLLLTVGSYFILPRLPYLLAYVSGIAAFPAYMFHYLAPHLEWFDMRRRLVHEWGPAPWRAFFTVMVYGAMWTAAALLSAWTFYRTKRFNQSS